MQDLGKLIDRRLRWIFLVGVLSALSLVGMTAGVVWWLVS